MAMNLGSDEKFAVILKTYDISIKNPSSTLSNFLVISTSWSILGLFGGEIGMRPTQEYDALYYATNKNTLCDIELQIRSFLAVVRSRRELDLREQSKREAIKSAKAAIMSRNMSHNLGSHVMAYLKQKLGSVAAIMSEENKVLSELYDGKSFKVQSLTLTEEQKNQVEMPFLVGLGRFIGYLQERQDYIATIATDYIPYGAPVNMKDAIYDELNPDLRYMRHHDGGNNRPLNILLSYIAKSEGLSRENMGATQFQSSSSIRPEIEQFATQNDILFGYITYKTVVSNREGKIVSHTFGLEPEFCDSFDESLMEMRRMNFSLPGGLVGRQAIFSVIENIIRNAAKHGNTGSVKNLCFTFDIIDCQKISANGNENEGVLELEKRICSPKWRELYTKADDANDLYLLSITDNLKYDDAVLDAVLPGLVQPYIDEAGIMTTANKGIKEIRISAAWLRGDTNENHYYHYDDALTTVKHAPLVAVEITDEQHLRYIVALKKNRMVAFIKTGMSAEDIALFEKLNAEFPNDWVGFDSVEDARKESKSSYKYILVSNQSIYDSIRPYISNRVRVWSPSEEQKNYINSQNPDINGHTITIEDRVLSIIYQMFTGLNDNSEPIYIWDGKAEECHKGEFIYPKIKVFSGERDVEHAKYVYRTHHAAENQFRSYWKDKTRVYGRIASIDAVTGDNSSDRLVRREPLNEEWYYNHLNALKRRVAIFDERLFKIVHNVDENLFIQEGDDIAAAIIKKIQHGELTLDDAKKEIKGWGKLTSNEYRELLGCRSLESVSNLLYPYANAFAFHEQEKNGNYLSAVYSEKGVDVFTIIKEGNGSFAIVGCTNCASSSGNIYTASFKRIGSIRSQKDDGFKVVLSIEESQFTDRYDYISIHQGILDKIYEGMGIKTHNDVNDVYKKQVTMALHQKFMTDKQTIGEYLPRFIIHSGRAKPTKDDMPQKQPFIQYAAIENGVRDCKYSLIELLDYARYEADSNDDFYRD